jgi:hypothetical protein
LREELGARLEKISRMDARMPALKVAKTVSIK